MTTGYAVSVEEEKNPFSQKKAFNEQQTICVGTELIVEIPTF